MGVLTFKNPQSLQDYRNTTAKNPAITSSAFNGGRRCFNCQQSKLTTGGKIVAKKRFYCKECIDKGCTIV